MVPSLLALVLLHIVFGLATSALNPSVCKSPLTAKTTLTSNSQAFNNGEWCGQQGQNNWIEFDFGTYVGIREVVIGKPIQGYVTEFSIQFVGTQSQTLQYYGSDSNKATVIKTGLNYQVGSSTITLTGVAVSKFRINIVNYSKQPCLKIDLHGCTNFEELCPLGCQNGGTCVYEEICACARGFEGHLCEKATCMSPLGMANSGIPDSALSVSSSKPGHSKEKARHGCCSGQNGGAWCPAVGDTNPWYEVSFVKPQTVSALDFIYPWYPRGTVATEYMKSFELQFWSALDPVKSWRTFAKDVPSIYNDTLYYSISLQPSIVANAIRILPLSSKKEPCIRFEVLGCDPKGLCSAGYCQNGGSCMGESICLCTRGYYGDRCEHTANELLTLNAGFQTIAHQILQTTTTIKFTVHGNPTLVSTSTGHAIHITSNSQYLVIDKTGFTSCLSDLDKCTNGFTITTNVHFTTLTDNTYIISSGGNLPNTKGIALYYLSGNIHFVVSTSTKTWHLVIPHKLTLNVWHHLELSWNQNLGCELVDNGKLVGSVTQPVPHQATIVKQIAIGHGYTQSTTHISMKVEGFKTVDANRASLVVAGIVTPAVSATTHTSPTPTTTVAMTTEEPTTTVTTNQMTTEFSCGAKEVKFDFMAIKGNVLVTPEYNFTVYKNPTIRPENNGHAVLILNTTGQYVELPNKGIECIQDMTKCESGFTLSLEIKWLDINSTNKRYIFSSGGDKVNNSGLALYLWHGELYCSAKKDKTIWTAKSKLNVKAGEWHSYQVSWNKKDGFVVYLDGQTFMLHSIKLPNPAQPGTFPLLIATTPGYNETSLMEVRNLYTWTASRDVLINHTCITEFPTVPPTTTAYHFTFIKIGHNVLTTTAFNLSVYGQPHLEHHSFTRNPVLILNGSNQYVEFSNNSNIGCLNNLAVCQSGFTVEVDVSLTKVIQQQKTVIISNSNQYLNGTGMALYFFNGNLYGYMSTHNQTWKVDYKYEVDMNKYHKYQISWSVTHGLTIFIDGHQVASTTHATSHKYTLIQHFLTIGKLHSVSYTTSMKLTGLTIWQASHQVLIHQGILTTAGTSDSTTTLSSKLPTSSVATQITTSTPSITSMSTTSSGTTPTTTKETTILSTIATTSSEVIKTYHFSFIAISHNILTTSSYNLSVHGSPHLEQNSVLVLNGSNQYVEFSNNSNIGCLNNLAVCQTGFTIKVNVSLIKVNQQQKTVIISNSNQYLNGTGMAVYFYNGHLYGYMSTHNQTWKVNYKYKVDVTTWHKYQISWSVAHGLTIFIDGHQVVTTTQATIHKYTLIQHALTIGKLHSVSYTTSMKLTGLTIWQASHQVLIQHGILTTAGTTDSTTTLSSKLPTSSVATQITTSTPSITSMSTTSSGTTPTTTKETTIPSTIATTSSEVIKTHHFSFIAISHNILTTSSYNLSVHGSPHLEQNSVLVLNGSNQFVEFSNNSNLGCLNNLAVCQTGFTIKVNVSLTKVNQQQKTVIISNSNQYLNGTGMALYFYNGHLYGYMSTHNQTWKVDYKYKVDVTMWHKYQISWSVAHGLTIFIDGHQVVTTTQATIHTYTFIQHVLTIGKLHSVSYTTSMKLTGLTIWQASHQVLIQHGILTTAGTTDSPTTLSSKLPTSSVATQITTSTPSITSMSTTSSGTTPTTTKETTIPSTIATTSSEVIKTHHFSFIAVSHNILTTSSYNLSVHGSPHLEQNSVLVLNGSNQFVEFSNNSNLGCLNNLAVCQTGFTIKVNVSLTKVNQQQKAVIISNSNQYLNGTGMALYFYNGHLYGYMSTHNQTWKVDYKYKVDVTMWHKYQISWSVAHGLTIFIDGHQVVTTTQATIHTYTLIQHALTIGKLHSVSYTTSMKLTGLTIWQASHQVLIQHGILTTAGTTDSPTTLSSKLPTSFVATQITTSTPSKTSMSTTSSGTTPTTTKETTIPSTITTTSSEVIKTHHFSFIAISRNILTTSSYNLSVHGSPHLEQNSVLVLNGSNQFVEFSNNSNLGCLNNLAVCQTGFTIKVNVSLTKVNQQQKTVIISNSNQYLNGTGMALYFYNGHLYGYMSTHNQTWKVDYKYKVDVTMWHKYQISWSVAHGLTIFIDGHQVVTTTQATIHTYTLIQHALTIGKLHSVSYTTSMKLTGLTIWQASHQVLIQHGILTTAMPTTTTLSPTTTKMDIPKFEWNFVKIPHSQTIIGSMFNATVHGTVNVNTSLGFNFNNTNQYIDLGVHSNLCFGNLSLCSCGLTIKITIMFTKLEENTVIISSGAEQATGTGLAMVYRYGQIHCMVSTATDSWFTEFSREKFIYHQVHQVIITWSPAHGLKVIINNYVISSVTKSIKHRAIKSFTEHMYIGNTPTVKSLTSCNYFMSSVIIWHCWIDNIVGEGELTTPIPETTKVPVTTPVKTAPPTSPAPALTTQFCKTGYVCKDDLTTHPTWKPTNPSKQPTTLKQTQPTNPPTKKPTTPKPTKATTQKPTARPTTPKPTKKSTTPKPTTPKPTKPTTRPTTPKPTTPRPSRPSYVTIPHLRPGVSNTGVAYFSCQFEKSKQPNVEFVVCLQIRGLGKCVKQVLVGGSYQEVKFTIIEINQNLFRKQITCTVQARWKGQIQVTPIKTSNIITPDIKIVTGNLVLTEGHPTEHLVVNVTAPPQMFCCKGCQGNCKVTITTHANFERFYQRCTSNKYIPEVVIGWAGTSQSPNKNQCGTSVSQTVHISSWQQIIKIPVKATVDGRIDRNTHNHFTVQGHVVNQLKPSITLEPHTLNVGQVQITANNSDHHAQCKSLNDPHMTTFDGRRYDNHNGGEFTLYKHTSLPYEVRAFYTKCSSRGRAYCNCGAAIKSGDDVITFQTCQRSGNNGQGHGHGGILGFLFNGLTGHGHGHGHDHHHHSTPARISVELYKNGELTPGTEIRRIGCGQKYQVILPTGTVVTVQSSGTQFINIWINPSSVDRGHTEGLCGSYDGNRYNDVFYPSNGRPDNNKNPTRFCMKWKQSQTIFYGVSVEKYNYINTFCSCIQNKEVFCNRGHGIMTCAKSRYDITSTILRQAKIPNIGHRHRRDVAEDDTVLTTTVMPVKPNTTTINYTSAEAYNRCKELVEKNKAVQSCWSTVNNTLFNTSMENCAADLVDSGDEVWANGYITDVVEECLNTLANQQQIVDGKVMLPNDTEVVNTTELCQQDCGQHGECIEGVCRCAAGYSGLSCDVSAEDTVPTMIIQPAGTGSCGCDRRTTDDCNTVTVYGDNFVESTTLTCHYEFTQGPVFGKPASLGRSATAQYVSINQVTCTLPEVNDGVYISISNNAQGYSSDWYLHTVYDSVCFDCVSSGQSSPAIQYNRKTFTCVINGQCFAANDKKPDDECKSCDSSNSDNKWTDSSDKSCKCSSETEVSKVGAEEDSVYNKQTVTILAVVIGILCFITMVSLFYNCKLRSKRSLYRKEEYATDDAFNHPQKKNFENPGYSYEQSENVKM